MTTGRKNLFPQLEAAITPGDPVIWVHCASLGEFEQGRPVIEALRKTAPGYRILLTFFSPSGYEARKDYKGADWVFYLPYDGARNAKRFLEIVKPSLVIFVKYEFWYYYLKKIKYRNIPLLLISALFRKDMMFFRWYGGLARKMLSRFDHLFVQNESSRQLLHEIGLQNITSVSGDTRFDRVAEIATNAEPIPPVESFLGSTPALIAGSTWPEDEVLLQKFISGSAGSAIKLVIAPHEISLKRLDGIKALFPDAVYYSELEPGSDKTGNCLVIDNIGMLSRLYQYACVAYVGGGLRPSGVHNVLEAAVYGKPVLFGPFYKKYSEAIGLVESGGGMPVNDSDPQGEMNTIMERLLNEQGSYNKMAHAAGAYVHANLGATRKITNYIQEKRLLTS